MSDEDLRDIGMSPNAVGQLRSIVPRSQPTNGLGQPATDKKLDGGTSNASLPVVDQTDNEVLIKVIIVKLLNFTIALSFRLYLSLYRRIIFRISKFFC